MNTLIIGGAGYIGSHVVREFLDRDYRVTVYDNLSSGLRQNLFPEADFIHGDILNGQELLRAMQGRSEKLQRGSKSRYPRASKAEPFDVVVYLAAFKAAGESMILPEKYSVNNLSGTVSLLNAMAEADIRRIIFSSSAAVYGEPRYLPIDEKHPTEPENYYGFTKLEIERILHWYDTLKSIRFAALRYFNAAGYDIKGRISGLEQNPANLIPVIMEGAAGKRDRVQVFGTDYDTPDGTCIRDYIHVSDLATGHAAALDYLLREDRSITVNLGSGQGYSVLQVLEEARRVSGKPIPADMAGRRPGDPAKLYASAQRAKEELGWEARFSSLESIISSTWDAYKNYP